MPRVRAAAILALAAAACSTPARMAVVPQADVVDRLAAEACVVATETIGSERAQALLEGHLIRAGKRRVLFVREWLGGALPARRLTASIDPELTGAITLPDPRVRIRADRARADGTEVRPLSVARGRLELPRPNALDARVRLEIEFAEEGEPPLRVDRPLAEPSVDALDAFEGRADRIARPEEFLRR
ncbi:MAG TPA: hypothetical protein VKE69_09090 [Planctomycetota bacterium]|nr:hypothetical protein [Planctomycetota bacterium]